MKKMKKMKKGMLAVFSFALITIAASSGHGFSMGGPLKGATLKVADDVDLRVRIRLQPRLDFGDLIKNDAPTPTGYLSETDMYLRRIRLELGGSVFKNLKYTLVFEADKNSKAGAKNEVKVHLANIDYKYRDALSVRFGKAKLPYSRVSLTSSSKQLLIERPRGTEEAKKLFNDYLQAHIMLHGKFRGGVLAYNLAVADGWEPGSTISNSTKVHTSRPLYVARVEFSPPGWVEDKKSDAHLGKNRHFTVGVDHAFGNDIEYAPSAYGEKRALTGLDVSGHFGPFTAQFEYNGWKIDYSNPATADKEPRSWYLQAGYFIEGVNIEPALRYEVYDENSNADDMKEKTTTLGANWYGMGHSFKIGANWARTKYEENATGWLSEDDTKNVFQVQAQLYF
jgi:phosphate-selective porin OprO/OprP